MAVVYGSLRIVAISAILWNMKAVKKSSRTGSNGRRKGRAVVPNRTEEGRRQERTIHFLTQDELRRLFKVMKSKRDRAIFLVAYRHGLRASEIGLLQRADVDAKQGRISIHRLEGVDLGSVSDATRCVKVDSLVSADTGIVSEYLFLENWS